MVRGWLDCSNVAWYGRTAWGPIPVAYRGDANFGEPLRGEVRKEGRARLHSPDAGYLQPHHRGYGRRHDRRHRGSLGLGMPSSVAAPLLHRGPEGVRGLSHFPRIRLICRGLRSEPPRTRTWNLEIKSLLLCQLS